MLGLQWWESSAPEELVMQCLPFSPEDGTPFSVTANQENSFQIIQHSKALQIQPGRGANFDFRFRGC